MKAKKTIRKLPPLARKLAHLQRDLHSLERKLTTLTSEATDLEMHDSAQHKLVESSIARVRELLLEREACAETERDSMEAYKARFPAPDCVCGE